MKNRYLILWVVFLAFSAGISKAQSWTPAGPDDSNQPCFNTTTTNIASDNMGGFYFAYSEYFAVSNTVTYRTSVRHWDGTNWQQTGAPAFSAGNTKHQQITASTTGIPYIAYKDMTNGGKAVVKMFNGTSWVDLGGFVSQGGAHYTSIAIDGAGQPYVAYADSLLNTKVTVKKWDGAAWQVVGVAGFTQAAIVGIKLKLSGTGQPVVLAHYTNGTTGTASCEVYRFNGASWNSIGVAGITTTQYLDQSIIDLALSANDTAYVAFADNANSMRAAVRKYNGSSWVNVGSTGVSPSAAGNIQIKVDAVNGPYLSCLTNPYPGSVSYDNPMVRHFNGTDWELAGPDSFVVDNISRLLVFDIDTAHHPHILHQDQTRYMKVLLQKFDGTSWSILGTSKGLSNSPGFTVEAVAAPDGSKAYCIAALYTNYGFMPSKVCRYDDTAWTVIGESGISAFTGSVQAIAIHPDGNPWIVVTDTGTMLNEVWRYTASGWVNTNIGLTELGGDVALCFDAAGNAYFAYQLYSAGIQVRKKSATGGWTMLNGSPIGNNGVVHFLRLKTNHAGVPHILAGIHGSSSSGSQYAFGIFHYDGNGWISTTSTVNSGMGTPAGSTPDFGFDTADVLHVTYIDNNQTGIAVKKFNAATYTFSDVSPVTSGNPMPRGTYPRIQFAANGSLYLSYSDKTIANTGFLTVKRLAGNMWQDVGNPSFTKASPYYPSLALLNNISLAAFTDGAAFAYKYSCSQPVAITQQPGDTVICAGGNASISTAANGAAAYRWQMNSGQGWTNLSNNTMFAGVTGATLSITAAAVAQSGSLFRCVYTSSCGDAVISSPAALLVEAPNLPAPTIVISADKPAACAGTVVTFTATTVNPGFNHIYEWRVNGAAVSGATGPVFTTSTLAQGDIVSCKFTRSSPCNSPTATANSNTVAVTIIPTSAPAVSIAANPGTAINSGEPVTFTATVTNGGAAPQYQWYVNSNPVAGAQAATYTTSTLMNGDMVTAKITRSDTCAVTNNALSAPLTMQVSTGVNEINKRYGFKIYPQPARDHVVLTAENMPAGLYRLTLHAITGQLVKEAFIKVGGAAAFTYRLNLPLTLSSGIYRMTLTGVNTVLGSTLSIER